MLVTKARQRLLIRRWRKALLITEHSANFAHIYRGINGFILSKQARIQQDAVEYAYGEIDFESFIALIALCNPNQSTVFYDLGSGVGKAVFACTMVFNVKKSCGIELFPILHQQAQNLQKKLEQMPVYVEKAAKIVFFCGDFLNFNFQEATLIFINSTAFFGTHWQVISKHMEQTQPETWVLSTSKALDSHLFTTLRIIPVKMSWGVVNVFIQKRVNNEQ